MPCAGISFLSVVLVGWITSLHIFAASALVGAGSVAFLPLVIIALVIFITLALLLSSFMPAMFGHGAGMGEEYSLQLSVYGFRISSRYYKWLQHRKRVRLWGVVLGALFAIKFARDCAITLCNPK